MATLDSLLKDTLLYTATAKSKVQNSFTQPDKLEALGEGQLKQLRKNSSLVLDKKLWEYQHPTLDTVTSVTARHRHMGDMRMTVLESIKWSDVRFQHNGKWINLPLFKDYLLATHHLPEGTVADAETGLWQLPANLHATFHHVFGYEFDSMGKIKPIGSLFPDFFPLPTLADILGPQSYNPNSWLKPADRPFRLLVCMALACMTERENFEPGGVLGAARILPHLMVMTNTPVQAIEATITLTRPSTQHHLAMDSDTMTREVYSGLYTDNNSKTVLPDLPYWNLIFDYYSTEPAVETRFEAVKRHAPERTGKNALQYLSTEVASSPMGSYPAGARYRSRDVLKLARQGEFDNIHIAPKMKLPDDVVAAHPASWKLNTPVSMAPFCVHDCFHTHWRWGNLRYFGQTPKWVRGWGGGSPTSPGNPYAEQGAPLVPCNQDVTVELLSPSSFKYTARAHAPVVGQWQVIMHHGSAYAISTTSLADTLSSVLGSLGLTSSTGKGQWARFYWALRYDTVIYHELADPVPDREKSLNGLFKFAERLKMNPSTLMKLRAL